MFTNTKVVIPLDSEMEISIDNPLHIKKLEKIASELTNMEIEVITNYLVVSLYFLSVD